MSSLTSLLIKLNYTNKNQKDILKKEKRTKTKRLDYVVHLPWI